MNGQDYTAAGLVFTTYRAPTLLGLSPNTGPSAGATVVRLIAEWPMHSGVDYRCGFGAPGNRTTPATYDAHSGDVTPHAKPGVLPVTKSGLTDLPSHPDHDEHEAHDEALDEVSEMGGAASTRSRNNTSGASAQSRPRRIRHVA